MVGSGIDNQYRYSDISQVDNLITDFYRPFDQSVVLVKLPCKFPECLTGLIRTIKDPLLHAHKILCLFFIIQKIDQIHIFLSNQAKWFERQIYHIQKFTRNIAQGINEEININISYHFT